VRCQLPSFYCYNTWDMGHVEQVGWAGLRACWRPDHHQAVKRAWGCWVHNLRGHDLHLADYANATAQLWCVAFWI
jgi:hypothetical protein